MWLAFWRWELACGYPERCHKDTCIPIIVMVKKVIVMVILVMVMTIVVLITVSMVMRIPLVMTVVMMTMMVTLTSIVMMTMVVMTKLILTMMIVFENLGNPSCGKDSYATRMSLLHA